MSKKNNANTNTAANASKAKASKVDLSKPSKVDLSKPGDQLQPPPASVTLDWQAETATMLAAAKEKPGSRGDQLGKVARFVASESPASMILRAAASKPAPAINGAQAFIELSRNVLSKLEKLAGRVADGQPYCDANVLKESKTGDASVPVALAALGAGDERQKAIVAAASARYPQGGNAQMPAALGALEFLGIVKRKETGSVRNAEYVIVDQERANKLIPQA